MRYGPFYFIIVYAGIVVALLIYMRRRVVAKLYQPIRHHTKRVSCPTRDLYIGTRTGRWDQYKQPNEENIHVWFFDDYKDRPLLLYFHGNSLNISYRDYMIRIAKILRVNLILVDYRGYGKSDGRPSSKGLLRDANVVTKFALAHRKPEEIIVWGESLGGSPATYVASKTPNLRGLILFSTFASFHSILDRPESLTYQLLYSVVREITADIEDATDNESMLRKCTCPVLIFHSPDDKLIDFSNAERLFKAAGHPNKKLIRIGGDHDSPEVTLEHIDEMGQFIGVDVLPEKRNEIRSILNRLDELRTV